MTVITPSLDIAQHFSTRADIQLILLGGKWDMQQRLFAGSATVSLLERYRADIAVLGTCALHADLGLSASQEADAEVKRAMLAVQRGTLAGCRSYETESLRALAGCRTRRHPSALPRSPLGRTEG